VVYSFGSNNDFTFEERVHVAAPHCAIHTFDPTSKPPPTNRSFIAFHSDYGLAAAHVPSSPGFATKTLPEIAKTLQHASINILKIDIEGWEWGVLSTTNFTALGVEQLLIELHPHSSAGPKNAFELDQLWTFLETQGYFLASMEPVTLSNAAQVEVVFLHAGWMPQGWQK